MKNKLIILALLLLCVFGEPYAVCEDMAAIASVTQSEVIDEPVAVPSLIEQTTQDIIEEDSEDFVDDDEEEVTESESEGEYEGDDLGEPSNEPDQFRERSVKQTAWYQRVFDNFLPRSIGWCGRWI